jgi:hypothetical protein
MLAPHIDRLFDKGFISFSDEGTMLLSVALDSAVLVSWAVDAEANVGAFDRKQTAYLSYHRTKVLRQ